VSTEATIDVVVVLPCMPAMAMPYLRRIKLGQHLRALDDGNLAGVGLYHLGIGSADRRTGDHDRGPGYVPGVMAFINCRPQLRKPVGHRTAAQIGARDLISRLSRISAIPLMPMPPMPMKCACWEVVNMGVRNSTLPFARAGPRRRAYKKTLPFCLS